MQILESLGGKRAAPMPICKEELLTKVEQRCCSDFARLRFRAGRTSSSCQRVVSRPECVPKALMIRQALQCTVSCVRLCSVVVVSSARRRIHGKQLVSVTPLQRRPRRSRWIDFRNSSHSIPSMLSPTSSRRNSPNILCTAITWRVCCIHSLFGT